MLLGPDEGKNGSSVSAPFVRLGLRGRRRRDRVKETRM